MRTSISALRALCEPSEILMAMRPEGLVVRATETPSADRHDYMSAHTCSGEHTRALGLCWHPWSCDTPLRRFVTHTCTVQQRDRRRMQPGRQRREQQRRIPVAGQGMSQAQLMSTAQADAHHCWPAGGKAAR